MLKIADNLSLPVETVTQTIAIIAKRRAGKSYTARRFAEQLFHAGQQIVIVDPKGDTWGIRSSADGKRPGLPVVILGGEHGDVPLEANSGEIVAKLIVEEQVSVLLDLSFFRKYELAQFMAIFLETLYRLKAKEQYRTPVMLVIDEADAIAPQRPSKGEERMLGAAEDIVRRGGQRGIGCLLVTQRSAVLNKNVLTQSQIIVALRTIAPQDIAALDAWIEVHGTKEERATLLESIAALPTGDAWFWSPGWPHEKGIFRRVHVLPIETFDSGATPKPGEKRVQPKNLADVDLDALKRQMAATIEKAKADDPRELKKTIAELQKQLRHRPVGKAQESLDAYKKQNQELREKIAKLNAAAEKHRGFVDGVKRIIEKFEASRPALETPMMPGKIVDADFVPSRPKSSQIVPSSNGANSLPDGEMKILSAAIQHGAVARDQLTVLTGYKRSTRDAYIYRLVTKGLLSIADRGLIEPTREACARFPEIEPLPTGDELIRHWRERLPVGERKILEIAVAVYPDSVEREGITQSTGFARSSRDAYIYRLKSRRLIEDAERGNIRASGILFDGH